ncbi:MAG: hypothetical protein H7345_09325, partial [Rubritepida sp.]|nr:hypothetical protein [Rubritepida sp.]
MSASVNQNVYVDYVARGIGKNLAGRLVAGSDDFLSAAAAEIKVHALTDLLQRFYMSGDAKFDDTDIGLTDVRKAILYARGKKHTKAIRKTVTGTAKLGLQIAAVAGGATIGSVAPVVGTVLGAAGGAVAGMGFGLAVTVADRAKRSIKGICKHFAGTRGQHRLQAAACLMNCHVPARDW